MERYSAIICILVGFLLSVMSYQAGSSEGYEQGRKDKHAEMMEFIGGSRDARIAVVSKNAITYHKAGLCAYCHSS